MNKNEAWIKESLEQFKRGDMTAHNLIDIKEEENMTIGKFDAFVVVTQIVIDLALAALLALVIFRDRGLIK